jgi:hypothetical protein
MSALWEMRLPRWVSERAGEAREVDSENCCDGLVGNRQVLEKK